jgi:hypothetical protein
MRLLQFGLLLLLARVTAIQLKAHNWLGRSNGPQNLPVLSALGLIMSADTIIRGRGRVPRRSNKGHQLNGCFPSGRPFQLRVFALGTSSPQCYAMSPCSFLSYLPAQVHSTTAGRCRSSKLPGCALSSVGDGPDILYMNYTLRFSLQQCLYPNTCEASSSSLSC